MVNNLRPTLVHHRVTVPAPYYSLCTWRTLCRISPNQNMTIHTLFSINPRKKTQKTTHTLVPATETPPKKKMLSHQTSMLSTQMTSATQLRITTTSRLTRKIYHQSWRNETSSVMPAKMRSIKCAGNTTLKNVLTAVHAGDA